MFRKNFFFGADSDNLIKVGVPRQGNYKVVLTIETEEPMKDVSVFAGPGRLGFRGDIPAGKFVHTFVANVCDFVPQGQTRIFDNRTLTITMVADKPGSSKLTVAEIACPTIYIAGDSGAADYGAAYSHAPERSNAGWGQMLPAYLKHRIALANYARPNANMDSFRKEGHLSIIKQYSKPGDFLFIQFGHDDTKAEACEKYGANLVRYIDECINRGLYPVLVTPNVINKEEREDDIRRAFWEGYRDTCMKIGAIMDVPVLDLYRLSMENEEIDATDCGAYKMAGLAAEEIKNVCAEFPDSRYGFLAKNITRGFGEWRI